MGVQHGFGATLYAILADVSCPSATQCTAVGALPYNDVELTFDPRNPALAEGCVAPNIKGRTLPQIMTILNHAGCTLGYPIRTRHSSKVPKNHAISQNPAAGRHVRSGVVNVVLSGGP